MTMMVITYFCDIDIHLKENFRNHDLGAFFFRDTSGPRSSAIAFRFTANLNIASYVRSEVPRMFLRRKTFSVRLAVFQI